MVFFILKPPNNFNDSIQNWRLQFLLKDEFTSNKARVEDSLLLAGY